ncbi:MAG: leucine-rich repeat protein [Clostridia bacterium]|nr:leucine-rich repeat protein [Clostridia bacterium]
MIGRYAVGRVLGKGGFGITYLCFDLKEKRKVAIKEYFPDLMVHRDSGKTSITVFDGSMGENFKRDVVKFFNEAKTVSQFNGTTNIISVCEFFYENNTAYYVMEYLSGTDMRRYLMYHKGKMTESETLYILKRITSALLVVHNTSTLHRDISPDNIILCDNGDVKLIDFGAARQVLDEASKSLSVIVKHGFAPIEQYQRRGKQGPWTDIYSLGATAYRAISGKMPDDSLTRLIDAKLDFSGFSTEFSVIIDKMMALKPEDRYQNITELKNDLDNLDIEQTSPEIKKKEQKNFCEKCGKEIDPDETLCNNCKSSSERTNNLNSVIKTGCAALLFIIIGLLIFLDIFKTFNSTELDDPAPVYDPIIDEISSEPVTGEYWWLENGVLTINGSDAMPDNNAGEAPWIDYANEITSVVIESGVTSVGKYAFYDCVNLSSVKLPVSVKKIGEGAFMDCTSLNGITISAGVSVIERKAFSGCTGLTKLSLPQGVSSVKKSVFNDCLNLESVLVENSRENITIEPFAFPGNTVVSYLKKIPITGTLEDGVLTISGEGRMIDYYADRVSMPSWRQNWDDVTTIIIEHGITYIGASVFQNARHLTSVSIPDSVISIGSGAFGWCPLLSEITIPSSVESIGTRAFDGCDSLETVIIENSKENVLIELRAFPSHTNIIYTD